MNNNTTKARFDAEKIEAGYKYLDSLRERMGVGQPAGEGGAPELLPCPNPSCQSVKVQSGSSLYPFYIYCANCLMKGPREGSDNLGQRWNSLPRAPQPATAPNRSALDEIEVALISIADGVKPADAIQRAFDVTNRERLRLGTKVHLSQYPLNGTQLECDGSELRPDGTCAKCERINERIASHFAATPTDVAERARRAVYALGPMIELADLSDDEIQRATDIIAAEFGGGDGGDGDEKGTQQ